MSEGWGAALSNALQLALALIGWKKDKTQQAEDEQSKADKAVTGKTPPPKD